MDAHFAHGHHLRSGRRHDHDHGDGRTRSATSRQLRNQFNFSHSNVASDCDLRSHPVHDHDDFAHICTVVTLIIIIITIIDITLYVINRRRTG